MNYEKVLNKDYPCTYPGYPRHADCKECKAYHHSLEQKTCCEKKKT